MWVQIKENRMTETNYANTDMIAFMWKYKLEAAMEVDLLSKEK